MNIKFIDVDKNHILSAYSLIKEGIYSCRDISKPIIDTKYHHHTSLDNVPLILKNGLLSKQKKAELEGRTLTSMEIYRCLDDYQVNGSDFISLSSMDVDFSKKHDNESLYDSYDTINADIIVSREIKTIRNTINYFNEYLASDQISPDLFNSIDVRILKILDYNFHDADKNKLENRIRLMIKQYNALRNIVIALKENNLDIPLREVSDEIITLDPEKVIRLPHLMLK